MIKEILNYIKLYNIYYIKNNIKQHEYKNYLIKSINKFCNYDKK